MLIRKQIGLIGLAALSLLSACGGGASQSEMRMPVAAKVSAITAAMAQPAPSMATLLAQARRTESVGSTETAARLVKAQSVSTTVPAAARHPDLVWFNAKAGHTVSWTMDGVRGLSSQSLLLSPDWRLTFTADLNGDGTDDYVWENAQTGQIAVWIMNGPSVFDVAEVKVLLQERGWRVTHVADFNGDERDDLLLRNDTTGQTVMWLMEGSTVLESAVLLTDTQSRVVAVGDLDGDGNADLVWDNPRENNVYGAIWWMDGVKGKRSGKVLTPAGNFLPTAASVTGGKGKDLIFNSKTYPSWVAQIASKVDGSGFAESARWSLPSTQFEIQAAADLAGEGRSVLIARDNSSGLSYAAEYLPGAAPNWRMHPLTSSPDWRFERAADLDGDGRADLIWRNASTGQYSVELMNGFEVKASAGLMSDPDWRLIGVRALVNKPPVARLKVPSEGTVGVPLPLDGSGSLSRNGAALSYEWRVTPLGWSTSKAVLSDANTVKPRFTPDAIGDYWVELVVKAGGQTSKVASTRVSVDAAPSNGPLSIEATRRGVNAQGTLYFPYELLRGLKTSQMVYVEAPSGFVRKYENLQNYPYAQVDEWPTPAGGRVFQFVMHDRPNAWPNVFGKGLPVQFQNPAKPGLYDFKVWSDQHPAVISLPVRIVADETALQVGASFGNNIIGSGVISLDLDVVSPAGMPTGSRFYVGLGTDVDKARLVSGSGNVRMEVEDRRTLVFTVLTSVAAMPGGRLSAADLRVEGIAQPLCSRLRPTELSIKGTEDTLPTSVQGSRPAVGVSSVLSAKATPAGAAQSAYDPGDEDLLWDLSFVAPSGLPAGASVLVRLPRELDEIPGSSLVYSILYSNTPELTSSCSDVPGLGDRIYYRRQAIEATDAVAPGGLFKGRFKLAGAVTRRVQGSFDIEVYTTQDSKPVTVTLTIPAL